MTLNRFKDKECLFSAQKPVITLNNELYILYMYIYILLEMHKLIYTNLGTLILKIISFAVSR